MKWYHFRAPNWNLKVALYLNWRQFNFDQFRNRILAWEERKKESWIFLNLDARCYEILRAFFFALINFGDFFAPLWIALEDSIMLEQSRLEELDIDAKEATGERFG